MAADAGVKRALPPGVLAVLFSGSVVWRDGRWRWCIEANGQTACGDCGERKAAIDECTKMVDDVLKYGSRQTK